MDMAKMVPHHFHTNFGLPQVVGFYAAQNGMVPGYHENHPARDHQTLAGIQHQSGIITHHVHFQQHRGCICGDQKTSNVGITWYNMV